MSTSATITVAPSRSVGLRREVSSLREALLEIKRTRGYLGQVSISRENGDHRIYQWTGKGIHLVAHYVAFDVDSSKSWIEAVHGPRR